MAENPKTNLKEIDQKEMDLEIDLKANEVEMDSEIELKADKKERKEELKIVSNYNVHVFYYPWYEAPPHDEKYAHWNHPRLPHWDPKVAKRFSNESHKPPDDIGANFYPQLGPYSSRDPSVIEEHMKQVKLSGAGSYHSTTVVFAIVV